MAEQFAENWKFIQENTWPSLPFFIIFLASVVSLIFYKKKVFKELFFYCVIVLALFIYNPYFWEHLNKIQAVGKLEALRLLWMLPALLMMAFSLTGITSVWKKKWHTYLAAALILALIYQIGTPYPSVFKDAENHYKISEESKEISDLILSDIKDGGEFNKDLRPTVLAVFEDTSIDEDTTQANFFYYGMRQYSSAFTLYPLALTEEIYNADGFSLVDYYSESPRYLVCNKNTPLMKNILRFGYHEIGKAGNYLLMRYHRTVTVYLARHGQTLANVQGLLQGSGGDAHLTAKGRAQAKALGDELADVKFSNIYISQLSRTRETAEEVMKENHYWKADQTPVAYSLLNDISWGSAEGMKAKDAAATFGTEALNLGSIDDSTYASPIGAETKFAATNRFRWAMHYAADYSTEDDTNVLVIAHSSISWWIEYATGVNIDLKNAEYVKLEYVDGTWSLA